jgi:hypothetical protein
MFFTISSFGNYFIENNGMWADSVLFVSSNKNANYFITQNGIYSDHYQMTDSVIKGYKSYLLFANSNSDADIIKGNESGKQRNIFYKNNNIESIASSKYNEVILVNFYDRIDLRYYYKNNRLRFDFIVNNGGKPEQISILSSDLFKLKPTKIEFANQKWFVDDLFVYEKNSKKQIAAKFIQEKNGIIKFDVAGIDNIIIDPAIYSTYLGGFGIDSGEDVAIDEQGNIIVVGETASLDFPTTFGAYQGDITEGLEGNRDIFVTKIGIDNNHILTTYIGSSVDDFARAVEVDSENNIYITGYTSFSGDFPTTANVISKTHQGASDIFVMKFNSDVDTLLKSTLIGSASSDFALDIAICPDKSLAITGYTNTVEGITPFPVSDNAFGKFYNGRVDGIVCKIDSSFSKFIYSGILGGLRDDFPQALSVGPDSSIYITGLTRSPNFPTTANVLFRTYEDASNIPSNSNAFVTKLSKDGSQIDMSYYFGGTQGDVAYGIEVDNNGRVYIAGETRSFDMPFSDDAKFKEINLGSNTSITSDGFIAKFSSNGDSLLYSSYIGGSSTDRINNIKIDGLNDIYLVGTTNSPDLPVTELASDKDFNDSTQYSDIFITKFSNEGDSLLYCSYFGGERSDLGKSFDLRLPNRLVITGNTSSTFFDTTIDAIQASLQDSVLSDAHVFEYFIEDLTKSDYIVCAGNPVQLDSDISSSTMSLTFSWFPNIEINDPNAEYPIVSPTRSRQYGCFVTDEFGDTYLTQKIVSVVPELSVDISGTSNIRDGIDYQYIATSYESTTYSWLINNGLIKSGQGTNNVVIEWVDGANAIMNLQITNQYGCTDLINFPLDFVPSFDYDVFDFGPQTICKGDTIIIDASDEYQNIIWNDGTIGRYDTVWTTREVSFSGILSNGQPFESNVAQIIVIEKPKPPNLIYNLEKQQLVCISAANLYSWYFEGELLTISTSRFFNPSFNGCYRVAIESVGSCTNLSDEICLTGLSIFQKKQDQLIFPNPAKNYIQVNLDNPSLNIEIYNYFGQLVLTESTKESINISELEHGLYFLFADNNFVGKFIKH